MEREKKERKNERKWRDSRRELERQICRRKEKRGPVGVV
jgi:hypothetical protein